MSTRNYYKNDEGLTNLRSPTACNRVIIRLIPAPTHIAQVAPEASATLEPFTRNFDTSDQWTPIVAAKCLHKICMNYRDCSPKIDQL